MDDAQQRQELLESLRDVFPEDNQEVDTSRIRYALYARKSTTDDGKQIRSIKDQISECMERVVEPNLLNVVEVYQESFSAKESGTREEFKRMVSDIKAGRIDGIIAWHPDRLSRNMKDAGEIIDMIDRGVILDLQFATSSFENNPSGKMQLGITFVIAKQYSEHLSESVLRGNRKAIEDGEAIGKFKHGYRWDALNHYRSDENYFTTVKKMFLKALEGKSQKEILEWIGRQEYKVQKKKGADPVVHKWTKDNVSRLLKDPHYAGIHKLGNNLVNLVEAYDFTPMITVGEFLSINKIGSIRSAKIQSIARPKTGNIRANLLRGIICCGHCSQTLTSMIVDKRKDGEVYESRYYYKCETSDCAMSGKSARGRYILDAARAFFKSYLFVTKDNYAEYVKNAREALKKKNQLLESDIASTNAKVTHKSATYEQSKELIAKTPKLVEHYDLDKQAKEIKQLENNYKKLIEQRRTSKDSIPTYEKYLKLFESAPVILDKIDDMNAMDKFLRIFFSNFTITANGKDFRQGSKVTYKLKEPWKGFLDSGKFVPGAGDETLTHDLIVGNDAL